MCVTQCRKGVTFIAVVCSLILFDLRMFVLRKVSCFDV